MASFAKVTEPTRAAKPTRNIFDAWNSSATGHQHAENRLSGSTAWRNSRGAKLAEQFKHSHQGGKRMWDQVGAGSPDFGVESRSDVTRSTTPGQKAIKQVFEWQTSRSDHGSLQVSRENTSETSPVEVTKDMKNNGVGEGRPSSAQTGEGFPTKKPMFRQLTFFISGSTYPHISDHRLKRLLAEHGARLSLALHRRLVTHIVIGNPHDGFASSKLQKEIKSIGGHGIKIVGVEWILESVKAGRRLPETGFALLKRKTERQGLIRSSSSTRTAGSSPYAIRDRVEGAGQVQCTANRSHEEVG